MKHSIRRARHPARDRHIHTLCASIFLLVAVTASAQVPLSWRSEATNALWAGEYFDGMGNTYNWWNGASGVQPPGNEILIFANDNQPFMTNDAVNTSRYQLIFTNGVTLSRSIAGSTLNTFYDFGGAHPKIENYSPVSHSIDFPFDFGGSTDAMEINPVYGDLHIGGLVNGGTNDLIIYSGNQGAGAGQFLLLGMPFNTGGKIVVRADARVRVNSVLNVSGNTEIDRGELLIGTNGFFGPVGPVYIGNGAQPTNTARLWLEIDGQSVVNPVTVNPGGGGTRIIGGLNTNGAVTFGGSVALNGPVNFETKRAISSAIFTGLISGPNEVTIVGPGTVEFTSSNTYSRATTISAGTLRLSGGDNRIATNAIVRFSGNSSLDLASISQTLTNIGVSGSATGTVAGGGSLIVKNGDGLTLGPPLYFRSQLVTMSALGAFTYQSTNATFRVGFASGTTNFATTDTIISRLVLASNNLITVKTFTMGDVTANSGGGYSVLRLGQTNVINADTITLAAAGRSSATLDFAPGLSSPSVRLRATDGTNAVGVFNIGSINNFTGNTWSSAVNFVSGKVDALVNRMTVAIALDRYGIENGTFSMSEGELTVTNVMTVGQVLGSALAPTNRTANGIVNFIGSGTVKICALVLSDNQTTTKVNNALGTLNLGDGTLLAHTIQHGAGTNLAVFTWTNGVIGNYDAATDLAISNGLTITMSPAGSHAFDISTNRSGTVSALLRQSAPGSDLTKAGSGTLTLMATNDYTGPTAVGAGTLVVNGSLHTGAVTVAAGATLGGTGMIAGSVSSGGVVAPGASPGKLTIGGAYTQNSTGTLAIELGGYGVGSNTDQLAVGGTASLAGTLNVTLTNSFAPVFGDSFVLLTAASVSGTFATTNLPPIAATNVWNVAYESSSIVLSITNESTPLFGYDLAASVITNSAQRGYQDDPDGDGYANLLEYVTGGSLTNADTTARMEGLQTNGHLTLKFTRDTNSTDAIIYVEGADAATNTANWIAIATNIGGSWGSATNVVEAGGPVLKNVTAVDSVPGTNRFLRMRVLWTTF